MFTELVVYLPFDSLGCIVYHIKGKLYRACIQSV